MSFIGVSSEQEGDCYQNENEKAALVGPWHLGQNIAEFKWVINLDSSYKLYIELPKSVSTREQSLIDFSMLDVNNKPVIEQVRDKALELIKSEKPAERPQYLKVYYKTFTLKNTQGEVSSSTPEVPDVKDGNGKKREANDKENDFIAYCFDMLPQYTVTLRNTKRVIERATEELKLPISQPPTMQTGEPEWKRSTKPIPKEITPEPIAGLVATPNRLISLMQQGASGWMKVRLQSGKELVGTFSKFMYTGIKYKEEGVCNIMALYDGNKVVAFLRLRRHLAENQRILLELLDAKNGLKRVYTQFADILFYFSTPPTKATGGSQKALIGASEGEKFATLLVGFALFLGGFSLCAACPPFGIVLVIVGVLVMSLAA